MSDETNAKKFAKFLEATIAVQDLVTGSNQHQQVLEAIQTPPAHELIIENPSEDIKTPQEVAIEIGEALDEKMVQAHDLGKSEKEEKVSSVPEKDAAKDWEKDIKEKETVLKESHEKQLQTLEQNKVMQESQLKDIKKEGYEEKLVQLDKVIDKEKNEINNKFEKEIGEIDKEKEAVKNAIDSTKDLQSDERNQEIERQRKEFERQQELERQKEAEHNR
jgi:hypothetical protein